MLQPDVIGAVQVKNIILNIAAVGGVLPDHAVCISVSRLNGDRICGWCAWYFVKRNQLCIGSSTDLKGYGPRYAGSYKGIPDWLQSTEISAGSNGIGSA